MKGFLKVYIEASPEVIEMVKEMKRGVKERERLRGNKHPKLKTIYNAQIGQILVYVDPKGKS